MVSWHHLFFCLNCFEDTSECSSSDSDTDDSNASEVMLKFPEPVHVDTDSTNDEEEDPPDIYFNLPSSLKELKNQLLKGYSTPAECPDTAAAPKELTCSKRLSLKHYIA